MGDFKLIEAVKSGDYAKAEEFIGGGIDVDQQDEHGWAALSFAAGNGDLPLVRLLIEKGADPFKTGRDRRTPYLIALAAGRREVAAYLREVEDRIDPERARSLRPERRYCRAYPLGELRRGPGWSESRINWTGKGDANGRRSSAAGEFSDDQIVFIHQDFTVTESLWHGENVIFDRVNDEWRQFCSKTLGFKTPTDLDLAVSETSHRDS